VGQLVENLIKTPRPGRAPPRGSRGVLGVIGGREPWGHPRNHEYPRNKLGQLVENFAVGQLVEKSILTKSAVGQLVGNLTGHPWVNWSRI